MTSEIIDQASALEEMMRDHAIQAHRLNHSAVSATHCVECGDNLPEARRRLAGKRIRDALCASVARVKWNFVRRLGGCDALQR